MKRISLTRQSGFTLLELLLTLAVLALVMVGVAQVMRSWALREAAQSQGQQLQKIIDVTRDYVAANINATPALSSSNDVIANATGSWGQLPAALTEAGLLDTGTGLPRMIAHNTPVICYQSSPTPILMIILNIPQPTAQARLIVRSGGDSAGLISSLNGVTAARGGFGQWSVNVGDLPGTCSIQMPTTTTSTIIAYATFNNTQMAGPYLYRGPVGGDPTYNQMQTDLSLGTHDLTNVGNMQMQNLTVSNGANFTGNVNATGTSGVTVTGPLNVTGALNSQSVSTPALVVTHCASVNGTLYPNTMTSCP